MYAATNTQDELVFIVKYIVIDNCEKKIMTAGKDHTIISREDVSTFITAFYLSNK